MRLADTVIHIHAFKTPPLMPLDDSENVLEHFNSFLRMSCYIPPPRFWG